MSSGHTIFTVGALTLITLAILNFNKAMISIDDELDQSRFRLEALSMLTSYIEMCSQYFFDEASTDTTNNKTLSDFTAAANLGFEANDAGYVDDFDDFNNLVIPDTGRSGVVYNVSFEVDYVTLSGNQIVTSSDKQYHKQMIIHIFDSYNPPLLIKSQGGTEVRDTLSISFVYSYWFYN